MARTPTALLQAVVLATACGLVAGAALPLAGLDLHWTLSLRNAEPTLADGPPHGLLQKTRVLIVDVALDDGTGSGLIGRRELARVVERIADLGAWVVGLDLLFEEPREPEVDRRLAGALERCSAVVLASRYDRNTKVEARSLFERSAAASGMANLVVDGDGLLRRVQHAFDEPLFRTRYSLCLVMASLLANHPSRTMGEVHEGPTSLLVRTAGSRSLEVPIDARGHSLIQYQGAGRSVPTISWKDLLSGVPLPSFAGKAVLIGDARLRGPDSFPVPFYTGSTDRIPGVEIHAQNLLGALTGSGVRLAGRIPEILLCLLGALVGSLAARPAGALRAFFGTVAGLALICAGLEVLVSQTGQFVSVAGPTSALLAALLARRIQAFAAGRLAREAGVAGREPADDPDALAAVAVALELLDDRRVEDALEHLQKRLSACGERVPARLRWALIVVLLARGEEVLALQQLSPLELNSVPLRELYRLAVDLENHNCAPEALAIYDNILSRDMKFSDAAARRQSLDASRVVVPQRLVRALAGRYQRVRFLAAGGMGQVYSAWDQERGAEVALKVPSEELTGSDDLRRRFIREIEALSKLSHPGVIKLIDVHKDSSPLYYTMELIRGESLKDLLNRSGCLDARRMLELLEPIASALAASHRLGIIHRDIKPANILLDHRMTPYLTDFGVAVDLERTRLTSTNTQLGTPSYMSPELLEGMDPGPRVDVYAFGILMFECLTGTYPFASKPVAARLFEEAPSIATLRPDVHPAVEALIASCIAREAGRRFLDGQALHGRIQEVQRELGLRRSDGTDDGRPGPYRAPGDDRDRS